MFDRKMIKDLRNLVIELETDGLFSKASVVRGAVDCMESVNRSTNYHWTDSHIWFEGGEWVAYDEAGLKHSRHSTRNQARDALVVYDAVVLNGGREREQHMRVW